MPPSVAAVLRKTGVGMPSLISLGSACVMQNCSRRLCLASTPCRVKDSESCWSICAGSQPRRKMIGEVIGRQDRLELLREVDLGCSPIFGSSSA